MSNSTVTVITPAGTSDLTTLDTLKEELGITTDSTDNLLSRYISDASSLIETYTNRKFAKETVQEVYRSNWHSFMLRRTPVTEILSVIDDNGYDTVVNTDYTLNPDTGEISRYYSSGITYSLWGNITTTITYIAGYTLLTELPRVIEQACLILCRHRWLSRKRDPMVRVVDVPGVMRQEYWVGSVGENGAIPPEVEGLLEPYRVRNI